MTSKTRIWAMFLGIGLAVAGLDWWTKVVVFDALDIEVYHVEDKPYLRNTSGVPPLDPVRRIPYQENIVVIENCFEFEATLNYGAFSGWFGSFTPYLALLSLTALVLIAGFLFFAVRGGQPISAWLVLALGLLWGGTLGNYYDRQFIGGVRDFIKWFVVIDGEQKVWPNFNIADSAICTAVSLIILLELLRMRRGAPAEEAPDPARETAAVGRGGGR